LNPDFSESQKITLCEPDAGFGTGICQAVSYVLTRRTKECQHFFKLFIWKFKPRVAEEEAQRKLNYDAQFSGCESHKTTDTVNIVCVLLVLSVGVCMKIHCE
jgi:hypothetical protein